jgi:hypothetical protein
MPSSPNYKRNYREEYDRYQGKKNQKKRRAARGRARYKAMKKGRVRLGDGNDIAHKDNNPNNNSSKNLAVQSKAKNRSFKRNKKAGRK